MSPDRRSDLDDVAAELYALRPDQFTAQRNARAQTAPPALARAIRGLRKPSVAAWAVNLLVRDGQLDQVLTLAVALREAQDDLDAAELASLAPQRRTLVATLARSAADLAAQQGVAVSPGALADIEKTINAAVVDAAATDAVRTARLVKALEADGFGASADSVGGSLPGNHPPVPSAVDDLAERRARKAAEKASRDADRLANEASRTLGQIDARRAKVQQRAAHVHERMDDLREDLAKLEAEAAGIASTLDALEHEYAAAAESSRTLKRNAERAHASADNL
ncbi:transposase [Microbacterium sp. NPDC076911]|uniref:transposase n=1 Tax=Microbacterium sp. NPDC076911 TaxID=3154958 RepID=UPI0034209C0E